MCRVTPHDAARYWSRFEAETYDGILLDAPCTSERHVLQQAATATANKPRWSVKQCQEMASLQVKLLVAALRVSSSMLTFCFSSFACPEELTIAELHAMPQNTLPERRSLVVCGAVPTDAQPASQTAFALLEFQSCC